MKAVAVVLLALVAACQSASLLRASPDGLWGYGTHLAYGIPATPVVYSAPKVTNVEVETPVITKATLNVLTDSDKISTIEIKPFAGFTYGAYPHAAAGYPYIY